MEQMEKIVTTPAMNVFDRMKQKFLKYAGNKHIAGFKPEDALEVCRLFKQSGFLGTISPWLGGDESRNEVFRIYRGAILMISKEMLPCQLSVKAVNFGYDYSVFKDILDIAAEHRVPVQVDSFDLGSAERTFALIEKGQAVYPLLGCTLPARWARSVVDAERVVEMQLPVRVVIGQWADPSVPRTDHTDDYLRLVDRLSGRAARIAIATHNRPLVVEALRRIRQTRTPHEIEQMVGLPFVTAQYTRNSRLDVRVYVPYGHPYLPYTVSDLQSRPRIAGFVLRDIFVSRARRLRTLQHALMEQPSKEPQFAIRNREVSSVG